MNNVPYLVFLTRAVYLLFCILSQAAIADEDKPLALVNPTSLIGITGVDDVMSDVVEPNASEAGGMELQRFFTTKMVAALNNCVTQTQSTFAKWYKDHALLPESEKVEAHSMKAMIWDKDKSGLFEAKYVLDVDKGYIRASLDYYRMNGEAVSLTSIKSMITDYKLNGLWSDLSEAMTCDAQ